MPSRIAPSAWARCACCKESTRAVARLCTDAAALKDGLILFAHGSREPEWARPFERIAARLRTEFLVELAYLERMKPTLEEALATLAANGVKRVRIVPLFLGEGGHVREDLPKLAAAARARHADVEIVLEPAIGERNEVTDAIAAVISKGNSHQSR